MQKYHNFSKIKNQKVLDLKFHKKIQWVPHAINSQPRLQAFPGGACVGISCYITKGLLTVTEYQLCLRYRAIAETSLYGAYHVKPFSLSLLPAPSLKARFHILP